MNSLVSLWSIIGKLWSGLQTILKLTQTARGHFVTLIESGMRASSYLQSWTYLTDLSCARDLHECTYLCRIKDPIYTMFSSLCVVRTPVKMKLYRCKSSWQITATHFIIIWRQRNFERVLGVDTREILWRCLCVVGQGEASQRGVVLCCFSHDVYRGLFPAGLANTTPIVGS